jgi:hypothetical protein
MKQLNKAHTTFHKTTRQQTIVREEGCPGVVPYLLNDSGSDEISIVWRCFASYASSCAAIRVEISGS